MQPHLAVLPDAFEAPLVVQHLVHHVQHLVHCLGVVGCGREGLGVPRAQGTLQHIQQGLAILADLQEGKRVMSRERSGRQGHRQKWWLILLRLMAVKEQASQSCHGAQPAALGRTESGEEELQGSTQSLAHSTG